ncbi:cold shock domain-containing protein [Streptomyces sp. NBC_01283]|uniref:cold-shock protein n=1 Tax=Streptomyces sp. NBC_01283 TaxID=2903812 RepID=UPI00352EC875|nr:cold shock domain-containing protein [Streptomyces sp. NBC_01283]
MVAGRVVRFDGARGYGFIAPEHGGEDVFLHANDLLIPEPLVHTGALVEFEIEEGERGPKASSVRLPERAQASAAVPFVGGRAQMPPSIRASAAGFDDGEEPTCDVLSVAEYSFEVTELLLGAAPWMTGEQIKHLREQLVQHGKSHGWVEG